MNYMMKQLRKYVSSEFVRKPRTFKEVKRWKTVEFRNFIIYLSPVVMYNNLDSKRYNHLLLLHTAVTILCSKTLIASYLHVAKQAIIKFVQQSAKIYPYFVVYNVHSLLHICKDVEMYGPLENFSCFPYENYLGKIKRLVRGTRLPLQQIANRITELDSSSLNCPINKLKYIPKQIIGDSQNKNSFRCSTLITNCFKLSVKRPNNIVSVFNRIVEIKHIFYIEERYKCVGTPFKYLHDLYNTLIPSSKLGIFFLHCCDLSITFFVEEINHKCLLFPFKNGYAVFPI